MTGIRLKFARLMAGASPRILSLTEAAGTEKAIMTIDIGIIGKSQGHLRYILRDLNDV